MASLNFLSPVSILNILLVFLYASVHAGATTLYTYGCVIDAGSSKSYLIIYQWPQPKPCASNPTSVPQMEQIFSYKIKPGISDFGDNIAGLEAYITDIVRQAKKKIPSESQSSTPIYLLATAGMRLLLQHKAYAVIRTIRRVLSNDRINPFRFRNRQARILSGEEEGAFAWITVNYHMGFFNARSKMMSVGVLEMGGASTQIAFIPEGPILANKFTMIIGGNIYSLYVHSYLKYGTTAAQLWLRGYLARAHSKESNINNPCALKGDTTAEIHHTRKITFRGSGNATRCESLLHNLVYKSPPSKCSPKPCAVGPFYQPQVPSQKPFLAISSFFHTVSALRLADKVGHFSLEDMREAASTYCAMSIPAAKNYTNLPDSYLSNYCFMGNYVPLLFTKAYGFAANETKFKSVKEINGKSTAWSLGALLYEAEQYSAAYQKVASPRRECSSMSSPGTDYSLHLIFSMFITRCVFI